MINPIQILKADLYETETLRNDYLDSLAEFQELFLEMKINNSGFYLIVDNSITVGYVIKTTDNILVEFYLADSFVPKCMEYFSLIVNELSIKKVYCKSFDYLLLTCCLMQSFPYTLIGILFRDLVNTEIKYIAGLSNRFANESDKSLVLQQKDGLIELYETIDYLESFIKNKNLILFYKEDNLAGCGTILRIHKNWNYYDIGVWVKSEYRNQGVGTNIISHLKEYCLSKNWEPVCGCAVGNVASKKTLEKSGFISKHKLIEFKVTLREAIS
jgi:RimJ/RimL family protein N-acetyltransferase